MIPFPDADDADSKIVSPVEVSDFTGLKIFSGLDHEGLETSNRIKNRKNSFDRCKEMTHRS